MDKAPIIIPVDDVVIDLIPRYLENRRGDVQALRAAIAQGDFDTIRRLGHSMKGSGGGYGLDAVTDMGRGLEEAGKAQDGDAAGQWLEKLEDFLERVQVIPE